MRAIAVFLLLFVMVAFAAEPITVDPPADGTYTMTPVEEGTSGTDLTISGDELTIPEWFGTTVFQKIPYGSIHIFWTDDWEDPLYPSIPVEVYIHFWDIDHDGDADGVEIIFMYGNPPSAGNPLSNSTSYTIAPAG